MALSNELEKNGAHLNSVNTQATATLEKVSGGWSVTGIHLEVDADVSNINGEAFKTALNEAKVNCPISRLLNTKITIDAKLNQKAA
jgi:osmotically inducible protein OsmC